MNYEEDNNSGTYSMFDTNKHETNTGEHSMFDVEPSREDTDRLSRLEASKNRALKRVNSGASLSDSFTDMGNGWLESNKNKMWNDLSDTDVQSLYKNVMGKALTTDDAGKHFYADGSEYTGSVRRAYLGSTKDPESSAVKFGLARGDISSSAARYNPELGGWESGEKGIDTNKFEHDVLLPYGAATMMESVLHGRRKALEGRSVKSLFDNPNAKADFGGGASEYYTSRDALFGAPAETDSDRGTALFDEYMAKLPDSHRQFQRGGSFVQSALGNSSEGVLNTPGMEATRKRVEEFKASQGVRLGDVAGRAGNTLSGFAATFVNELVVKPLDAIGDLTGTYDLDKDGDSTGAVEDFFGYDSTAAEDSIQKIGTYWDVAANSEATTGDRVRAAANGMLEAFTTPEMLGTSLGALMSWVTPGFLLKAAGVGSKFALAAKEVDALVHAGEITSYAGKVQKAKAFLSVDGAKSFLTSQSGFIASSLGNVNKQYEEFVQHNNGVELEGTEKAKWFSGRFAVQMVNQNLDKIVDINVMKAPGVMKALVPAVKAMTEKEFSKVVGIMAKGVVVSGISESSEAMQEYIQTTMELFNSRFGAEKFKDLDTFSKFLADEHNIREAGIGALAGAGGSAQFELVGAANDGLKGTIGAAAQSLSATEEYHPETSAASADVAATAESQRVFASDNEASNPAAAFYAAVASSDVETKTKANTNAVAAREAVIGGTHTIFNSDKPTPIEETAKIVELAAAADPEADYSVLKNAIINTMKGRGEDVTAEITEQLDTANEAGLAFARIKNMAEVSGEVSAGLGGFLTYYSAAKAAKNSGDVESEAINIGKLEKFHDYESTKLLRLVSKTAEVEGLVMAEAESLVTSGVAKNLDEALTSKMKEYGKNTSEKKGVTTTVKNSDKPNALTTDISHYEVALRLRTKELNAEVFNRGIYKLITQVTSEVKAMGEVRQGLFNEVQTAENVDVVTTTEETVTSTSDTDSVEFSGMKFPADVGGWLNSNVEGVFAKKVAKRIGEGTFSETSMSAVSKSIRSRLASDKVTSEEVTVAEQKAPVVEAPADTNAQDDINTLNAAINESAADKSEYETAVEEVVGEEQNTDAELEAMLAGMHNPEGESEADYDDMMSAVGFTDADYENMTINEDDYSASEDDYTVPEDVPMGDYSDVDTSNAEEYQAFASREKREVKEQDAVVKEFQEVK